MKTIIFILLIVSLPSHAQNITGVVKDISNGEALPGATIYLKNNGSGTASDFDGQFTIPASIGDTLLISFVGFNETRLIIGQQNNYVIGLQPNKQQMQEVVVKAERLIAEEFTQKKINKIEIYTNPSAKADPILAVNSTASATTTDESANISLRGSSPAETGIFLNNVPVNDAVRYSQLNGIGTFSIFNTALIKNVLVFPGNPPLEFGNTTSGLIALQTDEVIPKKSANTLSVTLASMGLFTQRRLGKRSSLTAFSNYQPSSFIKALNGDALEKLKKFNSVDLGLHYYFKPSDKSVIKIFNYGLRESYQFRYEHPTASGLFDQLKFRNFTIANYRHRCKNGEFSFNNGISFSRGGYNFSTIDVDLDMNDFYSSINYQHFYKKAEIKTGISYDYRGSTFNGSLPQFDYAIGRAYPTESSSSSQSVTLSEVFLYGKYFLTDKIIVGGGLRQSIFVSEISFLSSQFNINYKATPGLSIILATGQYNKIQLPQSTDTEPFLIKSRQHSLDIAYSNKKLETSLSLFNKQSIELDRIADINGVEAFVRHQVTRNFKAQLSITSLDAKVVEDDAISPSPYDITYFMRGNLEYKFLGTWTATTVFLFREGSYYNPVSSASLNSNLNVYEPNYGQPNRLPAYNSLDLSLSKLMLLQKRYSSVAFLSLSNIINFKNVRDYSYNFDYSQRNQNLFSKRTIYFGLVINF